MGACGSYFQRKDGLISLRQYHCEGSYGNAGTWTYLVVTKGSLLPAAVTFALV